jgi:dihydrodipicolinate synthase/N-acetylneuraminate lyase
MKANEAKAWAKENLKGIITVLIPTFTNDLAELNEKAIEHDIDATAKQGFLGISIITENGTTPEETKQFMEITAKRSKGKLLTSLLTTFPTIEQNIEMVKYANEVGVDLVQLGYPGGWRPNSLNDVIKYTQEICGASELPTILWAANMWGWCQMLEDPSNYPPALLTKFAKIPNIVGIKSGTSDLSVFEKLHSIGIVPGTVLEDLWPLWVSRFGAQWGGISAFNHFYYCTRYFDELRRGRWKEGMRDYFMMDPIRQTWNRMLGAEVGANGIGWTGHNRLRWKYAGWLVGLNGGPMRGVFRVTSSDMKSLRSAMSKSKIPVTKDADERFFLGRNPA